MQAQGKAAYLFDQQLTHSAQILASVRNVDPDFPKNIRGDHEASPCTQRLLPAAMAQRGTQGLGVQGTGGGQGLGGQTQPSWVLHRVRHKPTQLPALVLSYPPVMGGLG